MLKKIAFSVLVILFFFSCKEKEQKKNVDTEKASSFILNDFNKESRKIQKEFIPNENTVFKINHNFYNDEIPETILVVKDSKTTDSFDSEHFNLPIKIYKKDKLWKSNNHLIPKIGNNCVSEGFSTIVAKDNYFTIEQQLCYDYQILVSSFTTFKVVENEIYLHKYGENYFDKSNHEKEIPSKVWTQKDFGKLKFEDVTNDFLIKLRMK